VPVGLLGAAETWVGQRTRTLQLQREGRRETSPSGCRGPLAPYLDVHGDAQPFHVDEFLHRVAEREGVTPDVAQEHTRVVSATLREAVEFLDVTAQLPRQFAAVAGKP